MSDLFSERLILALDSKHMTAAELSRLADIPESVVSQYKKGQYEPKTRRLQKIAQILNVSDAWLMGYDVPMERDNDTVILGNDMSSKFREIAEIYEVSPDTIKDIFLSPNFDQYASPRSDIIHAFDEYFKANENKPVLEEDRLRTENIQLFDKLPKDKQQQALDYLRYLVDHQEKE